MTMTIKGSTDMDDILNNPIEMCNDGAETILFSDVDTAVADDDDE